MAGPSPGTSSTSSTTNRQLATRSRQGAPRAHSSSSSRWRQLPGVSFNSSSNHRLLLLLAAALLILQAAVAVNVVYDETGWTKTDWHKYKIDFDLNVGPDPADEALKAAAGSLKQHLSEAQLSSLHGPSKRKPVSKFAGLWARDDGSLVSSPSEDSLEQAAEAVMCTTCHTLVSHVWGQVVSAVNYAEPINDATVKELVEDACDSLVPVKALSKYRIVQVEAPELDMSIFVVRERKTTAASSSSSSSSDGAKQLPGSKDTAAAAAGGRADSKQGKGAASSSSEGGDKQEKGASGSSSSSSGSSSDTAAAAAAAGGGDARPAGMPSDVTPAEIEAVQKACSELSLHHMSVLQKQVWPKAKDYFAERLSLAQKVLTKAQWYNDDAFWEPDVYEDPDGAEGTGTAASGGAGTGLDNALELEPGRKLTPADQLCLDMDVMCPYWAAKGQCSANPAYMVGDKKHIGHCKASCKACTPKSIWKKHPQVKSELKKAASAAGQLLRTQACSASRACMAGGSGGSIGTAAATKEGTSLLPGAVLAKTPGFVLGKPFWGVATVKEDHTGGLRVDQRVTDPKLQEAGDETLVSAGLGNKLLSIPGMDNYFVYQLEYKRRVYQYAKDAEGNIKEEHVLGKYDPAATAAAAAKRDRLAATLNLEASRAWREQWQLQAAASKHSAVVGHGLEKGAVGGEDKPPVAPPMLELLDYLPDREAMVASHWPYLRQMYTGGEACVVEGKTVERQVELRAACSPDSTTHLLVREPNFCRYIMVLYHPQLCELQRYKPVPVLSSSSKSSSKSAAAKEVAARLWDAAAAAAAGGSKGGGSLGGAAKTPGGLPGAAAGNKAAGSSAAADKESPTWRRDRAHSAAEAREARQAAAAGKPRDGESGSKSKSKLSTV